MKARHLLLLFLALSSCTSAPAYATFYGLELVTDGGFAESGTYWVLGNSWQTIPGYAFHNEGDSQPISQPTMGVATGTLYEASYTITGSAGSTLPNHMFRLKGSAYSNCPVNSGDGTFTCQLTAPAGVHTLLIQPSWGFAGVLDSVSLREVLP